MTKYKLLSLTIITFLFILTTSIILITTYGSSNNNSFGRNIQILGEQKGDFNGDGFTDQVFLLQFNKKSTLKKEIQLYNPWAASIKKQSPFIINQNPFALGIIYGKSKKSERNTKKIIIYDAEFFSLDIWNGKQVFSIYDFSNKNGKKPLNWNKNITPRPMYVLEKNSEFFKVVKKYHVPVLNTDLICLWTGYFLYYHKGNYHIHKPNYQEFEEE